MTILAIADEESMIGAIDCGPVDVLISCGDLYDAAIRRAMAHYKPQHTLAVRGNHDPDCPFGGGIIDLHLKTHMIGGVTFGGFKGSWRYKPKGHHLFDQFEVSSLMRACPPVDVFVAHNSPAGSHERDSETHQGFEAFLTYIDRAAPSLLVHGHQHKESQSIRANTQIIGVFGERLIKIEN
jgi:Icc-related predicted phosphoesterase